VTNGNVTLSADGKSYANAANASFERRQGNSVQYWSPTFDGLKARIVYSANEGRSNSSSAVTQVNPAIWGFSAEYENGPAYVAWGYERHDDYFGLGAIAPAAQAVTVAALGGQPSASSRDTGNKLVGRYTAGNTQLGVIYERLEYDQTNSAAADTDFKSYARNAYAFTLVHGIGQGMLRALYGRARDGRCALAGGGACSADGLGVRQITLGYSYKLSEQTDLYGFYTRIVNDAHATYQFANAAGIGATAGADNIGAGLGVRYTFDKTF